MNESPYLTLDQFSAKHPAFPIGGLRHKVFHAKTNGLEDSGAIIRNGRRLILHERRFFRWLEGQEPEINILQLPSKLEEHTIEFEFFYQLALIKAKELAARYSELGIKPDALELETPTCILGILHRLQNHHDKVSSDGEE